MLRGDLPKFKYLNSGRAAQVTLLPDRQVAPSLKLRSGLQIASIRVCSIELTLKLAASSARIVFGVNAA